MAALIKNNMIIEYKIWLRKKMAAIGNNKQGEEKIKTETIRLMP